MIRFPAVSQVVASSRRRNAAYRAPQPPELPADTYVAAPPAPDPQPPLTEPAPASQDD